MSQASDQSGDTRRKPGPKPQPRAYRAVVRTPVYLTDAEHTLARQIARDTGVSLSELFRSALERARSEF